MEINNERDTAPDEHTVVLKLPRQVAEFAEFYAELCNMKRDTLIERMVRGRLDEIKRQVESLPYINIEEMY